MFGLGFTEILVILIVALIVFGPDKLPGAARTLGRTIGEFRRTLDDMKREFTLSSFTQDDITAHRRLSVSPDNAPEKTQPPAESPNSPEAAGPDKLEQP